MDIQDAFDISHAARIMALQEAAKVCADYADTVMSPESLAVELLGMARGAAPADRDLEVAWDAELAALVDGWKDGR